MFSSPRNFRPLLGLALLVLVAAFLTAIAPKDTGAPAQALADAARLYKEERYDRAAFSARRAQVDPNLKPWALVVEAQSAEKQGNFQAAERLYRQVPGTHAASLDSKLGLLRIEVERKKSVSLAGADISGLDVELKRAGRNDLQLELLFLRGRLAADHGDIEQATSVLNAVRRLQPGRDLALRARELLWSLQAKLEADSPGTSVAALVAEATQLLRENEPALALPRIASAKKYLMRKSPAFFEALLVEEQAQRALGKSDVADHILAEVAADGNRGTADTALLKIIKNAWNKNEHERVLMYIEEFRSRFGQEQNHDELAFIEARTFEGLDRKEDAEKLYRKLIDSGSDVSYRNRAIRQLAWAYYRKNRMAAAARVFAEGAELTKKALDGAAKSVRAGYDSPGDTDADAARTRVRSARDVLDDYLHHRFWFASTTAALGEDERKKAFASAEPPEVILRSLVEIAPHSYYGLLARKTLGIKDPVFAAEGAAPASCVLEPPKNVRAALELLHAANLREFSKAEIEWWLGRDGRVEQKDVDLAAAGAKQISADVLRLLLTRIKLSLDYSYPDRAVMLADSLFKRPSALEPFREDARACLPVLAKLAFPRPYAEDFTLAATANGVPASLLYAHSRTESYFDPLARSPKDARGLMQLLPSTAAREGMPEGGNLFDPRLNLSLGAKHLAGLLQKYQGNAALAASAYNAGSAATDRWLGENPDANSSSWVEAITYPETRDYVKKVLLSKALYE